MTARLVIFDVDGTLVDSQAHIVASMEGAFASHALPAPERGAILSIVGLSLPQAFSRLAPQHVAQQDSLVQAYKDSFAGLRQTGQGRSPLYPGAVEALAALAELPGVVLGVATGKTRRGFDFLVEEHGWAGLFQTVQVADHHPSKPHPSMVLTCLEEVGVAADRAVMVGDTSFDMEMARAAGVRGLGVSWGYHPSADLTLAGAVRVLPEFRELGGALSDIWGAA